MSVIVSFFGIWFLIALGMLIRRYGLFSVTDAKKLNMFVMFVCLPVLTFVTLYRIKSFAGEMVWLPVGGIVVAIVLFLISFIVSSILKMDRWVKGSFIITSTLPNSAFLGFPIILSLFGEMGLQAAVIFVISGNILAPTLINWVSTYYGHGARISKRYIVREILLFPLFLAFVLGIILNVGGIPIPQILLNVLDDISTMTIPLILISLGVLINLEKSNRLIKHLTGIGILKLVLSPILAFVFGSFVGLSGLLLKVLVIESAMPPAIGNMAFAVEKGLDIELTENAIFVLTVVSMVTVPVVALLV